MTQYARAEFLITQRRYPEALALFDEIVQRDKSTLLFDDILLRRGEIFRTMGRWKDAVESCQRLLKEYPESMYADLAQFLVGEIYESDAKMKPEAVQAFEQLLEKFPNSFYADDARKHIRHLRGESI